VFLIQGALLNDASALILFNLFLNNLFVEPEAHLVGEGNVIKYFVKVLVISPLLGAGLSLATVTIQHEYLINPGTVTI
jgi:NhaP-type Na+/H+ or K+/H+ antiporter